jgi:hypothetical protein
MAPRSLLTPHPTARIVMVLAAEGEDATNPKVEAERAQILSALTARTWMVTEVAKTSARRRAEGKAVALKTEKTLIVPDPIREWSEIWALT